MRKLITLVAIQFLLTYGVFSQNVIDGDEFSYDQLAIGISPSSFLNSNTGIQLSLDYRIKDKRRISLELAYIFQVEKNKNDTGYRFRLSYEFFFPKNKGRALQFGYFFLWRNTNELEICTKNNYRKGHVEYYYTNKHKKLFGLGISSSKLFRVSDKVRIETGLGLGTGVLNVTVDGKDKCSNILSVIFDPYSHAGDWFYPIYYFNFNISYVLKK